MNKGTIIILILLFIVFNGFASGSSEDIKQITAEELKSMMADKNYTLINVHIPLSVEIPGTDLCIPYNKIEANIESLPAKNDQIVLYCRSGSMSRTAYKTLTELGYTNVLDLKGGYNAWESAGYDLEEAQN